MILHLPDLFFCVFLTLAGASKAAAQYHITSQNWTPIVDSGTCQDPIIYITTDSYAPGMALKTYWWNGLTHSTPILNGGTYGYANTSFAYRYPGTYSIKHVLYYGGVAIDSIVRSHEYLYCNTLTVKSFYDSLGTGIFDPIKPRFVNYPFTVQVSLNNIPKDTISMTSGVHYGVTGMVGDVYSFKILSGPVGITLTTPESCMTPSSLSLTVM